VLVGYGSISFIDDLNHHSERGSSLTARSKNLNKCVARAFKKNLASDFARRVPTTRKRKRRPWIKHDPRFATCRYRSCLRHVFAQKLSSANGRCKKIFSDTQRSGDCACVIVVVHKLPPVNTVAEISPKTHAHTHTYTLWAPLIFTLNQFKGGAWKVDVTLRRLKRRARTRHRWPPL